MSHILSICNYSDVLGNQCLFSIQQQLQKRNEKKDIFQSFQFRSKNETLKKGAASEMLVSNNPSKNERYYFLISYLVMMVILPTTGGKHDPLELKFI